MNFDMGRVKQDWMEAIERGWVAPDKYVCASCVGDEFLSSVVDGNLVHNTCSYCGKASSNNNIAAKVEVIMPYVAGAFFHYFSEPGEAGLPRDSGEWVLELIDTTDAMESLDWDCHPDLFTDVCDSFDNVGWVKSADGWWAGTHENVRRGHSWNVFADTIKHKTRYFFHHNSYENVYDNDLYDPVVLLSLIGKDIERLGLLKNIDENTYIYRARICSENNKFDSFEELGPPPNHLATAGRMNPVGISYGYFSFSKNTCIREVSTSKYDILCIGKFRTRVKLLAIDLTRIPEVPSIFDIDRRDEMLSILFLNSFADMISREVRKDGMEHIEYIPTQVFSEYFYRIYKSYKKHNIDAVIYKSATGGGGKNIVLFPPRGYSENWTDIIELISSNMTGSGKPASGL